MPRDFPYPRQVPDPTPDPDPVVANGRIVPRRKGEPLKVLNAYSRFAACVAATAGTTASLMYLDWRWVAIGLVVGFGIAMAGPWVRPS